MLLDFIDIGLLVEFKGIVVFGDIFFIGVGEKYVDVVVFKEIRKVIFVFVDFVGMIGDFYVCYMGMLGGFILNNDLVVDYFVVCLGLDVIIYIIDCFLLVEDFFVGMFEIVFSEIEIVVGVDFKVF